MFDCDKCIHENICDISSRQMWAAMAKEDECSDFKDGSKFAEVVRCKDCEYYSKNILGSGYVCQYWQTWYQTNGNDYCSFGAKMDGKKVE